MKPVKLQLLAIILATTIFWGYHYAQAQPQYLPAKTPYQLCFSPDGNCEEKLVHLILSARDSIYVQSYSFTSRKIANALNKKVNDGVKIKVIADRSLFDPNNRYSKIKQLIHAGAQVWVDKSVSIQHNKVMIVDHHLVETGSYNFTVSANRYNAENMLIIDDQGIAERYLTYWHQRQQLSVPARRYRFKRRRFPK